MRYCDNCHSQIDYPSCELAQEAASASHWEKTVQKKGQQTEMNTVDGIQGIMKEMYGGGRVNQFP